MYLDEKTLPEVPVQEPAKIEQWRADLLATAEYIRQHGWCQNTMRVNGRVCMVGALADYTMGPGWALKPVKSLPTFPRYRVAYSALRNFLREPPAQFNDQEARTKEEVISALEAAARQ